MALYSLFKLTVLCALFQAAAAIECSGTRTPENSPFGVYSNVKPVPVGKMGMEVTTVDLHFHTKTTAANFKSDVTYTQHLVGCLFEQAGGTYECKTGKFLLGPDMTFTNGHFYDASGMGSKFIPVDKPNLNPLEKFINDNLKIDWCPEQQWFVVVVAGPDGPVPYKLQSSGPMYAEERRGVSAEEGDLVCDCDYHHHRGGGGCSISQAAPKYTACKCVYKGGWTCQGGVVRCRNENDPLCLNPDKSIGSCNLGGGDCGGYH